MKKLLCIMLAVLMTMSMAACGGETQTPAPAQPQQDPQTQTQEPEKPAEEPPKEQPASQPSQSNAQTEPAKPEETKPGQTQPANEGSATDHLRLIRGTYRDFTSDEFDGRWYSLANYRFDKLWLDDEQAKIYPKLQEVLMKYDDDTRDFCYERLDEMTESAKTMIADGRDPGNSPMQTWEITTFVTRADDDLFSFVEQTYCYMGGVHPDTFYECYNYDPKTGEAIEFTDLVKDVDAFKELVTRKLKEDYEYVFENYSDSEMKTLLTDWFRYANSEEMNGKQIQVWQPQWYAGNEAMTVIFNEYDIAPYAAGTLTVSIPYKAHPELFDMERVEPAPDFVTPLIWWWGENYDLGHDGVLDEVGISSDVEYDEDMEESFIVGIGITTDMGEFYTDEELWYTDADAYIVHTADGCDMAFIYCESMWEAETQIFDITNGVAYAGTVSGWYEAELLTDPSHVPVSRYCNVAGTFAGEKIYRLGELGSFDSDDPYYTLLTDMEIETIDVLDLPLILDPAEGRTGDLKTVPAGSSLLPLRTNDYDWIDFKVVKTGDEVRMYIERGEYESDQYLEDGRSLYDVFDVVYWAG